ncbi:unnamed protein product [Penicillium nalgiovense]|uniref:Uncharacterized protein n=1 Tax=Penicillium nalgiovense TaxID=60175 RepID=A0A9W4MSF6_PENNA|nr:unnamed protein product [Penicillium nalgiovense]CAG7999927.1 unnamed protein product [Penicillium nalgiovense]CAG8011567.1 unnamed protein product [Penicillium nalgiovense]CAG8014378.1 unnamed protein product [Penicillium nalgiovense]CAG8014898.1 unnamed protein product [Penicillium nalgiovense]
MFRSLVTVIAILGQVQALDLRPLIRSTCNTVSIWHQAMGGSLNATLSTSGHTQSVSLLPDCEAEMESALSRCVDGPSIDCRSIAVSLDGQVPLMALVNQHAERAAGDEVHSQQQSNCSCQSPPLNRETTSSEGTQSQTSISTESTVSATQAASSSCEIPNISSFASISTSPSAPSETHSPTTTPSPKGSGELDLNTCLIKEADHRAGGFCHCASGSAKVFESAECTLVH